MKDLHRKIRTVLIVALLLGMGAVLIPTAGNAVGESHEGMSTTEWLVTPASQLETLAGRCSAGEICKELCETFQTQTGTQTVGLNTFSCFTQ